MARNLKRKDKLGQEKERKKYVKNLSLPPSYYFEKEQRLED